MAQSSSPFPATPLVPPTFQAIDANGVDLSSGQLVVSDIKATVGPAGYGGLAWGYVGTILQDTLTRTVILSDPTGAIVNIGGVTANFGTGIGAAGQTLSCNNTPTSSSCTHTAADGTVTVFNAPSTYDGPSGFDYLSASTVTRPNGEVLTYTYSQWDNTGSQMRCLQSFPGGPDCSRITSVTSSFGYMVKYDYVGDALPDGLHLAKVTAINLAVEYCSPTAPCSVSPMWMSATFSGDQDALNGKVITITDALGQATTYTIDSIDRVTKIQRPGGSAMTYSYVTDINQTSRVATASNGSATWHYDYTFPQSNQVRTVVTDPQSHTRTLLSINGLGVQTDTDALGATTTYAENPANGLITRVTAPEGNYVNYTYDARGNITEIRKVAKPGSGLADHVTTAVYPATCDNPKTCNKPTAIIDGGAETDFTYDPNFGGVLTVTEPAGVNGVRPQTRYTYDASYPAYLTSTSTVASAPFVVQLHSVSQCMTQASCAGSADEIKTIYGYPSNMECLQPTEPCAASNTNNLIWTNFTTGSGDGALVGQLFYFPDRQGDIEAVTGSFMGPSLVTRKFYDANRQPGGDMSLRPEVGSSAVRPRVVRRFHYNADGVITSIDTGSANPAQPAAYTVLFALSQTAVLGLDTLGRKISESVATADGTTVSLTQYSYDTANRLVCTAVRMNPAAFGATADACALGPQGSDGPDRIAKVFYDADDRVTSVIRGYGTTAQVTDQVSTYTPNGLLASVTDANGNVTTFTYDGFDRPSKTSFPSAVSVGQSSPTDFTTTTYDPVTWDATQERRRDGQVVTLTYDARHRVISKDQPSSATYAYDNLDRQTSATQNGQTLSSAYDALGRVTSTTGPLGTVNYQYNLQGDRTRMTWPDGYFVTYDVDDAHGVLAVRENGGAALATFGYANPLSLRTSLTLGNGAATAYGYDTALRLGSLAISGTTQTQTLSLGYNAAGQVTGRTSSNGAYAWTGPSILDRGYTINGLNQVTATTGPPASLSYDPRGNLTSDGTTTYSYNADDQLTSTSSGAALSYDPAGRLYQTTSSGGAVTRFLYDGDDIIGEYDGSGTLVRRYVHGPGVDEPLVAYAGPGTSGNKTFLQADQQGSVVASSDASGNAAVQSYDEYGIPAATNAGRFQYTGQAYIPEIGMYSYKARIYSPILGRFLQSDPSGYDDGLNLYGYVHGDPVNGTDPSGLGKGECGTDASAGLDCVDPLVVFDQRKLVICCQADYRALINEATRIGNQVGSNVSQLVVTAARRILKPKDVACPTGPYVTASYGGSATAGLVGGGSGSLSVNLGRPIVFNLRHPLAGYQLSFTAQGAGMVGYGAFVGAGTNKSVGFSSGANRTGRSSAGGIYGEADAGAGEAGGASGQFNRSSASGAASGKLGYGLGLYFGGGRYNSVTYSTPRLFCGG